jgi:hypothetical protein
MNGTRTGSSRPARGRTWSGAAPAAPLACYSGSSAVVGLSDLIREPSSFGDAVSNVFHPFADILCFLALYWIKQPAPCVLPWRTDQRGRAGISLPRGISRFHGACRQRRTELFSQLSAEVGNDFGLDFLHHLSDRIE